MDRVKALRAIARRRSREEGFRGGRNLAACGALAEGRITRSKLSRDPSSHTAADRHALCVCILPRGAKLTSFSVRLAQDHFVAAAFK